MTDSTSPRRVLIAAADTVVAASLQALLAVWDCDVRTATGGATAIAAAEVFRPAVVLIDLQLKFPDSCDVARPLRDLA